MTIWTVTQTHADYVRANARLFRNQQPFDWAIVQSEALAQLRSLDLPLPAKVINLQRQQPARGHLYGAGFVESAGCRTGPGRCWTWTNASCTACTTPRTSWPRWPWGTCSACPGNDGRRAQRPAGRRTPF